MTIAAVGALVAGCGDETPNAIPSATGAEFSLAEDAPVFFERVFASDPDATSLQFRIVSPASHGTAQMSEFGEFSYVPHPDFFGIDSFTFAASDGKAESQHAVVKFTIAPVPDEPRLEFLGARMSDPDDYPTRVPLTIVDPDGDPLTIEVHSDDFDVARVELDASQRTVLVRPRAEGIAGISVRVSDGVFVVGERFEFSSLPMETIRTIEIDGPNENAIMLSNVADFDVSFQLDVNGHMYPGSRSESLTRILDSTNAMDSPVPATIWRAISENTRRGATVTESTWAHGPVRLLNSLGFGYCDDVASAFALLAAEAGLEARVWTLNGHVVPEVLIDGRWQMYDVDIGVIYHNADGEVAGVEELVANPTLITNPIDPILATKQDSSSPFSQEVADIYATYGDNQIYDRYTAPVQPTDSTITLPAGGSFTIGGLWSRPLIDIPTGNVIPFIAQARLALPAGWLGRLPTAFVVVDVQGEGGFRLNDLEYEIGSDELAARLADLDTAQIDLEIVRSDGPIVVTVLINSLAGALGTANHVMLTGLNVGALSLATSPLPEADRLGAAASGD
jgi:hypothetical protein